MNNDRASSFLCSFQTFQTFNVVCTRAQVHCATRDTEHLPGGVQPNLQYVTWYRTVPRYICRRLARATLPRALFPEGTDRRPFLLQRVVFFLIFCFCHPAQAAQAPPSIQKEKRELLFFYSLVPHGVPECHLAFPRLGLGSSLITSPLPAPA